MVKNADGNDQSGEFWEPPESWLPPENSAYANLRQEMKQVPVQRFKIKSPRTGNVVHIRVPSSITLPKSPDFDLFHRATAVFLRDLLPSSHVVLTYQDQTDPENSPVTWGPDMSGCRVFRYETVVPGDGSWFRTLDVWIEQTARDFLQYKRPDISCQNESRTTILPPEFDYLHAHAVDAATIAVHSLDTAAYPVVKESIEAELATMVIGDLVTLQALPKSYPGQKTYLHFAAVVRHIIRHLQALAATRVEHSLLSHGVVVSPRLWLNDRVSVDPYPACLSRLKRSSLLSDGDSAVLVLDRDGFPVRLFSPPALPGKSRIRNDNPPELRTLLAASRLFRGTGLLLRKDGSIVVAIRGEPLLVNRGGTWRTLLWRGFKGGLRREIGEELADLVAAVALQHSLRGTGCILGIVDEDVAQKVPIINQVGVARSSAPQMSDSAAWLWHRLLPTQSAINLGVDLLWVLSAIDGATLISPSDKLLTYGAIMETEPAPTEGARTSAARCLSRSGLVVKVSADGPISVWRNGIQIIEI